MITAHQFDSWRVVPRILVLLYGMICYATWAWYTGLAVPSAEQTTFASVIWGAAAAWFGFYTKSGRQIA